MRKLLIVDDDTATCSFLEDVFSTSCFRVQTANDGQVALEVLAQEGGWVVLLDLEMPILNGQAVIQHLQADTRLLDHNRVVLMSGNHVLTMKERHNAPALIQAVLLKPFDMARALQVVARLDKENSSQEDKRAVSEGSGHMAH